MAPTKKQQALIFTLFFLPTAILVFAVSIYNFHRHISISTDENIFVSSPSRLTVVKTIPALARSFGKGEQEFVMQPDSVRRSDFLLQLDGRAVGKEQEVLQYLASRPGAFIVEMGIFRPSEQKYIRYQIRNKSIPLDFLKTISASVTVVSIVKDGASDRSGMQVGDVITRINETSFNSAHEADRILRSNPSGATISYEIIRQGKPLTLNVQLARFGTQFAILVFVISGWLWMIFGVFLALKRPCEAAARLLGTAFLLMGLFISLNMIQRIYETPWFFYLRFYLMYSSLFLSVPLFLHAKFFFPKTRDFLSHLHWLPLTYYLISLAGLIAFFIHHRFMLFFLVLVILLILQNAMTWRYRKSEAPENKRIVRPIWIATALAVSIILGLLIAFVLTQNQAQSGLIGIPLLLVPVAFLYIIGRYRLMDIDLRIRRNIQYTIISLLWSVAIFIALIAVLNHLTSAEFNLPAIKISGPFVLVSDTPVETPESQNMEKGFLMFLAVALTFAFYKIGVWGQKGLDQKYFRTKYNYRQATSEFSEVISTPQTISELAETLVNKLAELMHLQRAGVFFFRDESQCCCHKTFGYHGAVLEELCSANENPFLQMIRTSITEERFSVRNLPRELAERLHQENFDYLVPIRSKGKFLGVIFVGSKLSETPLNQEDFEFLSSAAKQAAVAGENAFLYEELSENQRITHELEIARHIQMTSIPQSAPSIAGLDISGISIPAQEVGGDFYDFLTDNHVTIDVIIGDVSGKGISAALYMSKIQGILRSLHAFALKPRELFIRANDILSQDLDKSYFITSLGVHLDTQKNEFLLARAGHLPLFYYNRQQDAIQSLTPKGLGLGLENNGLFAESLKQVRKAYRPGDVLLFVTDGVTEAFDHAGNEFGELRLRELLHKINHLSATEIRNAIIKEIKEFARQTIQQDDQTVVVVKACATAV